MPFVMSLGAGARRTIRNCSPTGVFVPASSTIAFGLTPSKFAVIEAPQNVLNRVGDNIAAMPAINKINANIARFADGDKIRFLNINDKLADKDGKLFDGMMNSDRLHPALKGYQVWADALKPVFTELLGRPANEDHAPPPTGDPSAAR